MSYRDRRNDSEDDDLTFENGQWQAPITQPDKSPARQILKARRVAGSVVVTLPRALRDQVGIVEGDHLMVSLDRLNHRLVITKE